MSAVAGLLNSDIPDIGEWQPMILKRTHFPPPFPSHKELRDRFRGSLRPPCKRRAKLSPTQAAKVRWKRQRRTRRDWLLWRREWNRRDVLALLMKRMKNDEVHGRSPKMELSWWEKSVV